jgi:hypothetical protein
MHRFFCLPTFLFHGISVVPAPTNAVELGVAITSSAYHWATVQPLSHSTSMLILYYSLLNKHQYNLWIKVIFENIDKLLFAKPSTHEVFSFYDIVIVDIIFICTTEK